MKTLTNGDGTGCDARDGRVSCSTRRQRRSWISRRGPRWTTIRTSGSGSGSWPARSGSSITCATGLRREFETTLPRFDLMAQLERHPGGLRMSELSRRLMVSGGNVTGITDQLEREHLVVRIFDPSDRRVVAVKLTAAGLARFRDMAACHEQWIIELLAGLDQTDKLGMFEILQKLKAHVTTVATATPASDSAGS